MRHHQKSSAPRTPGAGTTTLLYQTFSSSCNKSTGTLADFPSRPFRLFLRWFAFIFHLRVIGACRVTGHNNIVVPHISAALNGAKAQSHLLMFPQARHFVYSWFAFYLPPQSNWSLSCNHDSSNKAFHWLDFAATNQHQNISTVWSKYEHTKAPYISGQKGSYYVRGEASHVPDFLLINNKKHND